MNYERSLSIIGRRFGIRGACFSQFLLAFFLISPQWCPGQLLPPPVDNPETAVPTTMRRLTILNRNDGFSGVYADLFMDDTTAIVWLDYYPGCGQPRESAHPANAMLQSMSKPFELKPNSRISFTHGLWARGDIDSLPLRFPDINVFWRLRLADDRTGDILATLDSMSLEPRMGYDACKGFFTTRFNEKMRVYFGHSLEAFYKGKLHLVLDLQPMMLSGMEYRGEDEDLDKSYGDGLDGEFGYSLMDTVRARGTHLLDVAPCGPGMLGVDIALPDTREVRLYRQSGNQRQTLFSSSVLEGYSRILVPVEATNEPCTYELESDAGDVLASFVHHND